VKTGFASTTEELAGTKVELRRIAEVQAEGTQAIERMETSIKLGQLWRSITSRQRP
jgi:hypothetical protein